MRLFFSRHIPSIERLLLVESGSRYILDNLIPGLVEAYGTGLRMDVVTCFNGQPEKLPEGSRVYRVWEYPDGASRKRLLRELQQGGYNTVGIICSGEPLMTKWKWWLALQIPAKVFVLNENGDYYWFDYSNWRIMLHFALFRVGLTGADAVTTVTRVVLFPFTLCYLMLFAAAVHLRRKVRT